MMTASRPRPTLGSIWGDCLSPTIPLGPRRYCPHCQMPLSWCPLASQFSSVAQSCATLQPHGLQHARVPVHHQLPEFTQTHVHWISDSIQPSHLLLFLSPPTFGFPSIRVFSNDSLLHIRWPKCWSFSFSISPSSEYSELIYFRRDWLDLLEVQGTLKSLLQHHSPTLTPIHYYWKIHCFD